MKCHYCKEDVRLNVWGKHSQECEDRKRIRAGDIAVSVSGPAELEKVSDVLYTDLDDMSKDQLMDYLSLEMIEFDPKSKKKELLKLAKGE